MRPTSIDTLGRAVAIAACVVVVGCSTGAGSIEPAMTAAPTAVPSTAAPESPSDAVTTVETPTPSPPSLAPATPAPAVPTPSPAPPTPSPAPARFKVGTVVKTLVDDVRVRSKPRVTDSDKYTPLLPAGTRLLVLDGPVKGSGYRWFWVAQLSSPDLPSGWVAAAGRDGEAWLGKSTYHCPAVPDTVRSLAALPRGVGLACFSRVPITFRARLFAPNGDFDPGDDWIDPAWLWSAGFSMIFEPSAVRREGPSLHLLLDPAGHYPGKLDGLYLPTGVPVGKYVEGDRWTIPSVVKITGKFDHPAASTCEWVSYGEPSPAELPFNPAVETCRLEFAVTRIAVP